MEFALREAGAPRIFAAAFASAVTKPFGKKGVFYRVAGPKVAAIDGPTDGTIPPYNRCCYPGAQRSGASPRRRSPRPWAGRRWRSSTPTTWASTSWARPAVDPATGSEAFSDNPLGQGEEQTPWPFCEGWRDSRGGQPAPARQTGKESGRQGEGSQNRNNAPQSRLPVSTL